MENEYKILKTEKVKEILSDNLLEFVALEKIHGTNFSFLTDGQDVQCCRRSDILKQDENFFNWKAILNKYKINISKLFDLVKNKLKIDITQIQLYGELYGGNYPSIDYLPGHKMVQKGIYYSSTNEFAGFDLKYFVKNQNFKDFNNNNLDNLNDHNSDNLNDDNLDDNLDNDNLAKDKTLLAKYLDWDLFVQVMEEVQIPIVPVIKRGLWVEISQLDPKFESKVYLTHGLPKIQNNWAEGYVIKPVKEIYLKGEQERLIWKFKNPSFSEIVKSKSDSTNNNKLRKASNTSNPFVTRLEKYVCENRYDNVISKVIEDTKVDEIVEMFYQDVWVDFFDDLETDNMVLTDLDKKECEKKLRGLANGFIRKRYVVKK
jgi:hypothetical protein